MADLFDEAVDWLRIPSISAGERDEEALRHAAEWAIERVRRAGGTAELRPDTPAARRWSSASCARRARTRRR